MKASNKAIPTINDFFNDISVEKVCATGAAGLLLTWIWMAFSEGYPAFMDGVVDAPSVVAALLAFAASMLAFGLARRLDGVLAQPALWVASAIGASTLCLLLVGIYCDTVPASGSARLMVERCASVLIGLGAGVLVQCCGAAFARLRPASAAVEFFQAGAVVFIVYFVLNLCKSVGSLAAEGILFSLLPLVSALLLSRARDPIVERLALRPEQEQGFASGYVWMSLSFGVFFFAFAAKMAMEPVHEFAVASDMSVVFTLLLWSLFFYLVVVKARPVRVFSLLKVAYVVSVVVLTVSVALAPLSLDPYMSILFKADFMVQAMVLWVLVSFVAFSNETYVCKVVGVALGTAAAGMAAGWLAGSAIYAYFDHSRLYFSIGIACMTAVFSTVGFSCKNFPYLINQGKGAEKMQRFKTPPAPREVDYVRLMANEANMSSREYEVFKLLAQGYNATSVAQELTISYHTARTHVRNVYKKLDVHSHAELLDACKRFRDEHSGRGSATS